MLSFCLILWLGRFLFVCDWLRFNFGSVPGESEMKSTVGSWLVCGHCEIVQVRPTALRGESWGNLRLKNSRQHNLSTHTQVRAHAPSPYAHHTAPQPRRPRCTTAQKTTPHCCTSICTEPHKQINTDLTRTQTHPASQNRQPQVQATRTHMYLPCVNVCYGSKYW